MIPQAIALVDDDPYILGLLQDLLGEEGYRTLAIREGGDAFRRIAQERPDLVILDLWMEEQETGWRIYEELCAHDPTTHIPIIICSADAALLRERTADIEARGDVAVEKPFEITALLAQIAQLIGGRTED